MNSIKLGVGRPERGNSQLPAEFVVAPGGELVHARYGTALSDTPQVSELLEAAQRACR